MKKKLRNISLYWFVLYLFLFLFSSTHQTLFGQNQELNSNSFLQENLKQAKTNTDSLVSYMNLFVKGTIKKKEIDKYVKDAENVIGKYTKDSSRCLLYLSIGKAYSELNDIKKSTIYTNKTLRIAEKNVDSVFIARAYYQLGRLNFYQGDVNLAIKYLLKNSQYTSSHTNIELRISSTIALGAVYNEMHKYNLADSIYHITIRLAKPSKSYMRLAMGYSNLAEVKAQKNQIDSAFYYIKKGKEINQKINYKLGIAWATYVEGKLYGKIKQWKKADENMRIAISIWEELNSLSDLASYGYSESAKIQEKLGNYKQAYLYTIKNKNVNDSIRKEENIRHIQDLESQYQSEKDSLKLANVGLQLKQEKIQRISEQNTNKRNLILFLFIGIVLVVNSIYFIYKLRVTKKAKSIIEEQKVALELKNKEITDSINYAKRIQNTIIPDFDTLQSHLPASFIFYRPKDIVAGDFYWLEQVDDWTFCAVADCTGHGVPGAMVSVVCANALNKIILEKGEKVPGRILDKVRSIVVDQFYKSGEGINDGMDISLCAFNFKTLELNWSGANNPLWLIRDNELIEKKGDKQPIGKYIHNKAFKNHSLQLQKNDVIYLFTDGFADQFGGDNGKKLKNKYFKEWILSVHHEAMDKQHELTDEYFDYWKGSQEQLDDVCVMGIRIA